MGLLIGVCMAFGGTGWSGTVPSSPDRSRIRVRVRRCRNLFVAPLTSWKAPVSGLRDARNNNIYFSA